jgi:hypothetical protein
MGRTEQAKPIGNPIRKPIDNGKGSISAPKPARIEKDRLAQLELVVTEMDAHIQHLHGVLSTMQRNPNAPETEEDPDRKPMRDKVWACENCNARLGIYNTDISELRIRYKDFVAYVKPGVGGYTMVPCRRCGEQNKLEDTGDE